MKQYDAVIIGSGKGGKTLALELAAHHLWVAVIERSHKMYGGTCPNVGCIPSKFLIHQAKVSSYNNPRTPIEKASDYRSAIEKKDQLTAFLRRKNYDRLASNEYIHVYQGEASFQSADTISITSGKDKTEIQGKKIFIDTGSEPSIPEIPGIRESSNIYTSTSLMDLKELPKHLVIIGGGYIGLEFASMYTTFGAKVTILESEAHLLPKEDRDIAFAVKESMEKKGISFKINVKIQSVYDTANGTMLTYRDEKDKMPYSIEADAVLVATGRKPVTEGLNLKAAGVSVGPKGNILTDVHLHTTSPNIYALGDVKGGTQFTYISLDDYRIIRDELFGDGQRTTQNRGPVPYCMFIEPPLSRVGMSEEEALKKNIEIKVANLPASQTQRARTLDETQGLLKAVIDARTNEILGCAFFCTDSQEIINMAVLAMKMHVEYSLLKESIYTHPSMSEAFNYLFDF